MVIVYVTIKIEDKQMGIKICTRMYFQFWAHGAYNIIIIRLKLKREILHTKIVHTQT